MNKRIRNIIAASLLGLTALTATASNNLSPSPWNAEAANRVIVVADGASYVNVFFNDVVLFKVGDTQFAVKFDGNKTVYDLEELAPAGFAVPKIKVYVSPNPSDRGVGFP